MAARLAPTGRVRSWTPHPGPPPQGGRERDRASRDIVEHRDPTPARRTAGEAAAGWSRSVRPGTAGSGGEPGAGGDSRVMAKVMVVMDGRTVDYSLMVNLLRSGFDVAWASDPEMASLMARVSPPDAFVVDGRSSDRPV